MPQKAYQGPSFAHHNSVKYEPPSSFPAVLSWGDQYFWLITITSKRGCHAASTPGLTMGRWNGIGKLNACWS